MYDPFCYIGAQYDRKTQLYYLRVRYYDPVRYVDPSGHCKQHCKNNGVGSSGEDGGSNTKGLIDGAPEPEVQNFIERFRKKI